MSEFRLRLLEGLLSLFGIGDVHQGADIFEPVQCFAGVCHDMDILDPAIRHYDAVLQLPVLRPLTYDALDDGDKRRPVVGMGARFNELERRLDIRVVLEDAIGLLRPPDFSACHVPGKASRLAQPLRRPALASLQRNRAGRPLAILETNNDVTERKRAENALRRSEANLAEAQRLSKTGSFAWDVTSGKVRWSEEAYRIFEHDPKVEPTLELVKARTHPDDRSSFVSIIEGVIRERTQNWEFEHRIVMPDGRIKNIHVMAHAGEALDRLEYIGALMDVTDTKQAQEALQQAQAELAHITRVTTLGELTASIAHEVNQPLAAVVTNAEVFLALARAQRLRNLAKRAAPLSALSRTPTAQAR